MRLLALLFCLTLFFSHSSFGTSLKELLDKLDTLTPPEIKREISSLSDEDKLKLEILLSAYRGDDGKLFELLFNLKKRGLKSLVVANAIKVPKGKFVILVDKKREVLYLVKEEKGIPKVIKKFPCITGKRIGDKLEEGDQRTPEGIYFPLYWKANLPPLYGLGAFPLNYPNLIDRKIIRRDGHGIWIHGTNNPKRPPHSSNGCIVLKNSYLRELKKYVTPKETPVVIVNDLTYSPARKVLEERESLLSFIKRWKRAWENSPVSLKPYFDCYSQHFVWNKGDIKSWKRYKKRVTKSKRWIRIKIRNLYLVKDGRVLKFGKLYVASFELDYRSNNFNSKSRKILYLIKEGGKWKILGEENL